MSLAGVVPAGMPQGASGNPEDNTHFQQDFTRHHQQQQNASDSLSTPTADPSFRFGLGQQHAQHALPPSQTGAGSRKGSLASLIASPSPPPQPRARGGDAERGQVQVIGGPSARAGALNEWEWPSPQPGDPTSLQPFQSPRMPDQGRNSGNGNTSNPHLKRKEFDSEADQHPQLSHTHPNVAQPIPNYQQQEVPPLHHRGISGPAAHTQYMADQSWAGQFPPSKRRSSGFDTRMVGDLSIAEAYQLPPDQQARYESSATDPTSSHHGTAFFQRHMPPPGAYPNPHLGPPFSMDPTNFSGDGGALRRDSSASTSTDSTLISMTATDFDLSRRSSQTSSISPTSLGGDGRVRWKGSNTGVVPMNLDSKDVSFTYRPPGDHGSLNGAAVAAAHLDPARRSSMPVTRGDGQQQQALNQGYLPGPHSLGSARHDPNLQRAMEADSQSSYMLRRGSGPAAYGASPRALASSNSATLLPVPNSIPHQSDFGYVQATTPDTGSPAMAKPPSLPQSSSAEMDPRQSRMQPIQPPQLPSPSVQSQSQPSASPQSQGHIPLDPGSSSSSSLIPIQNGQHPGSLPAGVFGGADHPYARPPQLRESHKIAERKRRKEMKDLFDELRDCLPPERGLGGVSSISSRTSKWEILSKAIDCVTNLRQHNTALVEENASLKRRLDSLTRDPSFSQQRNPSVGVSTVAGESTPAGHQPQQMMVQPPASSETGENGSGQPWVPVPLTGYFPMMMPSDMVASMGFMPNSGSRRGSTAVSMNSDPNTSRPEMSFGQPPPGYVLVQAPRQAFQQTMPTGTLASQPTSTPSAPNNSSASESPAGGQPMTLTPVSRPQTSSTSNGDGEQGTDAAAAESSVGASEGTNNLSDQH